MLSLTGKAQTPQDKAKSWMGAPIMLDEKAEGALVAQNLDNENAFTDEQFSFLQSLASMVSIRWRNDLLNRELQQFKTLDEKSSDISRKIQTIENIDDLVKFFGSELLNSLNAKELEIILQPVVDDYAVNSSNPQILTKKLSN
jgi:GAF domain-containing protein